MTSDCAFLVCQGLPKEQVARIKAENWRIKEEDDVGDGAGKVG